jgi:acyl-[acyl-carrier-protein] desaturase
MGLTEAARQLFSKIEVLQDLELRVRELMVAHEEKRELWMPADLLEGEPDESPDDRIRQLRARAAGIPDAARAALALNLLTEEGLPHFHRLLAVHLGDDSYWREWINLWTAEEDRHGAVLRDYARDSRIFDQSRLEHLQFAYLRQGFHPGWDSDPYRVFAYTTVQERATQVSHRETGKVASEYEPKLGEVLSRVAREEARHYTFYRTVFEEILARDPDQALESAAHILPGIEMPGASIPGFREFADVIRRSGIYGPRDYLRIVQEQIRHWKIDGLHGLSALGRRAQARILEIPDRLKRVAEYIETRNKAKTFSFDIIYHRHFVME